MSEQMNPLCEVEATSLDELFSSRPPFSANVMRALVAELRRMREKWKSAEEVAGASALVRASKKRSKKSESAVGDLWD